MKEVSEAPRIVKLGEKIDDNKVGIAYRPREYTKKPEEKHLVLPQGLKTLRYGRFEYTDTNAEEYIEAYYQNGGSFTRACRAVNTRYAAVRTWMAEHPEFAEAIKEIDDILKDEVHSQFMTRVLHEWEPNPAWKFKYMNKHFPEYSETKKSVKISFQLKDSLIKPDVVEGVVVKKAIEEHATGPQFPVDAASDTD